MFAPLQLDRSVSTPLQDQLYEQLRQMIISGKIKPKSRVIATRYLAEQVGVSRTTVLLVYEKLISEGYLNAQPTIGTFVSDVLPDSAVQKRKDNPAPKASLFRQAQVRPTVFGRFFRLSVKTVPLRFDFCRTLPDSGLLPSKIWRRHVQQIVDQHGAEAADLVPPEGLLCLRQTLADWLSARRGISIAPEQIVVVSGLRQACAIVSHLFQRRGDRVVVESPCNEDVLRFLSNRSAAMMPIPVDADGIMTDRLPVGMPVSLAYVTPACQNPIGGTLPLARRERLISWAREVGAYLIEDDTDSDIRYQGAAPLSLAALDPYGLVFHVGSFSKTLGGGICLGYVVAPVEFAKAVGAIKSMSDDGCSWAEQRTLDNFIASGSYDQYLRRLCRTLLARRDCLVQALTSHFGAVEISGSEVGTQLAWTLPPDFPSAQTVQDLARAGGVDVYVLPKEDAVPSPVWGDRTVVLSYAALTEGQIKAGIAALARILKTR